MLPDVLSKKNLTLTRLREWILDLQTRYGACQRQVCGALKASRSSVRYRSVARDSGALCLRIRELAETPVNYGYRRVHILLRREGWCDNYKRIYRLYRDQRLSLRLKRPHRNKSARCRQPVQQGRHPNLSTGGGSLTRLALRLRCRRLAHHHKRHRP